MLQLIDSGEVEKLLVTIRGGGRLAHLLHWFCVPDKQNASGALHFLRDRVLGRDFIPVDILALDVPALASLGNRVARCPHHGDDLRSVLSCSPELRQKSWIDLILMAYSKHALTHPLQKKVRSYCRADFEISP